MGLVRFEEVGRSRHPCQIPCSGPAINGLEGRAESDQIRTVDAAPLGCAFEPAATLLRSIEWSGLSIAAWSLPMQESVRWEARPAGHLVLLTEAGRRRTGESRIGLSLRSHRRDAGGTVTVVPAASRLVEQFAPATRHVLLGVMLHPGTTAFTKAGSVVPRLLEPNARLRMTLEKMRLLMEAGRPVDREQADAIGTLLALELRDAPATPVSRSGGLASWQRRVVCDHIEERLAETIPLSTLARLAKVSPFHLCRAFSAEVGSPPRRYQIKRRIERAKELLTSSSASVTEVAMRLGFVTPSHFARRFRLETGSTPSAWRATRLDAR